MAAGLPVVATRSGGPAEVVEEASGLLVPPGDPVALAAAMETVIAMPPAARAKMGGSGRDRVQRLFSRKAMLDRWSGIYALVAAAP